MPWTIRQLIVLVAKDEDFGIIEIIDSFAIDVDDTGGMPLDCKSEEEAVTHVTKLFGTSIVHLDQGFYRFEEHMPDPTGLMTQFLIEECDEEPGEPDCSGIEGSVV